MFSLIHSISLGLPLPFRFWFDPIVLEFALGMILGVVYQADIRVPDFAGVLLLLAAITGFYWTLAPGHIALPSWIGLGIPSLLVVAAVSLTKTPFDFPVANKLGDASYAIYLVHPIIIAIARKFAARSLLEPIALPWVYLICVVAASIGAAVIVHEYFERPITVRFRNWLLSRPGRLTTRRI
jgi:peptidoglycan/LPS O-acetylase OafA/YrhL